MWKQQTWNLISNKKEKACNWILYPISSTYCHCESNGFPNVGSSKCLRLKTRGRQSGIDSHSEQYQIGLFKVTCEQQMFHAERFNVTRQTILQMIYMASHALRQQARHTIIPVAGGWFMEHRARSVDRLLVRGWVMCIGLAVDVNILWLWVFRFWVCLCLLASPLKDVFGNWGSMGWAHLSRS